MRYSLSALAGAALCSLLGLAPALAQDLATPANPVAPLMHGALVFHGNYCGPGNKGIDPAPVDALDAACMRHDACVKDFQIPSCGCNARLAEEAAAVAADPRAPADEREAADFTAHGAEALPCQ
jgi:hypothetical protein